MSSKPLLLTIGAIAQKVQARDHVVLDAIRRLGIEPTQKAGTYRLFGPDAVEQIRKEVLRRAERRAPNV